MPGTKTLTTGALPGTPVSRPATERPAYLAGRSTVRWALGPWPWPGTAWVSGRRERITRAGEWRHSGSLEEDPRGLVP